MAELIAICTSDKKGIPKSEIPQAELKIDHGIVGDSHAGNWHRQVSLLAQESADKMRQKIPTLKNGAFAENLVTKGLVLFELPIGTRLRIGPALLEVTQIGKECHAACNIKKITGDCVMPREGIFAKVIEEGVIKPGDKIEIEA